MDGAKRRVVRTISDYDEELRDLARQLWENPELGLHEEEAATTLRSVLRREGFDIRTNVADMRTAFVATYGDQDPELGILGEFDALPDLSQRTVAEREPRAEGAPGHGCGHNLLGVGSLGAALALKEGIRNGDVEGTVTYFGCPAEEQLVGKSYMARAGAFDELDACLTWHPGRLSMPIRRQWQAIDSIRYEFSGVASHAAVSPESGRSALDAVQLMNTGVEYLREHVPDDVSLHYVIDDGGAAPNVVPSDDAVWYYVRGADRRQVERTTAWLDEIAEGAAMMTRTELARRYLTGCHSTLHNAVLSDAITENLEAFDLEYTDEERAFARELRETLDEEVVRKQMQEIDGLPEDRFAAVKDDAIHTAPVDAIDDSRVVDGSSDVGDVSWITPTAEFFTATWPVGTPAHTWQAVAASGCFGERAMIYAAKVLAATGYDLLEDRSILSRAREEFETETDGAAYRTPLPEGAEPPTELIQRLTDR